MGQEQKHLYDFFYAIKQDSRIGASHISLFCALVCLACQQQSDTVLFKSAELMQLAKISSPATYHKCIKALHEYGYIDYHPSFNHARRKNRVAIKV
jgi:hypothetical protein